MNENRKGMRRRTRRLAASAVLAAIGVAVLYLGALIEVLDLSVVVIASLVCIFAVIEMGGAWPWLIYAVVSVLSLILLPVKTPAAIFLLFGGSYPIVKAYLERLRRVPAWILKAAVFNVALTLFTAAVKWLFLLPDVAYLSSGWGILITYAVGNAFFVLYDVALTRLITAYLRVFRKKLRVKNL